MGAVAVMALLFWFVQERWWLAFLVSGFVVIGAAVPLIWESFRPAVRGLDWVRRVFVGIALALVGWILAMIQIHLLDKWFLRLGRHPKTGSGR